jgi:protein-S-isoprenylcysteine O-methyltransferase Ste14
MYLLAIPFYLFLYGSIVSAEERFLGSKFGDGYREYCRDVPRWIPDFSRLRESLEGMSFNWRRVILKDYGTVAAWALTACLLLILEAVAFETGAVRDREIRILVGVIAVLTALWALARWLKVSKRLRSATRLP